MYEHAELYDLQNSDDRDDAEFFRTLSRDHGPRVLPMKHAYLTIDDAPSADFLAKVDFLGRRGIPALFFCIGERIEARFDEVVRAVKSGFVVGNHSYSHPRADRRDALQRRLGDLGYALPRLEGLNSKYSPHRELAEGLDLRCTFDQAEYHLGSPHAPWGPGDEAAILARIDEDEPDQGRPLPRLDTADEVLVHDHEHTAALFRRLIDRYLERGIGFHTIEAIQ